MCVDEIDEPRALPYMRRTAICDLFAAGLERVRASRERARDADVVKGEVFGEDGRLVRFDLAIEHGLVRCATFRASPCISLVAYAEWLASYVEGKSRSALNTVSFDTIISGVPEVNASRKHRARLLIRAFESALHAWDRVDLNGSPKATHSMRPLRSSTRLTHSFVFDI